MNKFITAVTNLDVDSVRSNLAIPRWVRWAERSGKNALHYLGGVPVDGDGAKADASIEIAKMLIENGLDINSIHNIPDDGGIFLATPLWYAYTKGRNERLYRYLLDGGARPDNCWWAIAWYNDVHAAELFLSHGAKLDKPLLDHLFVTCIYGKQNDFAWWALERGANLDAFAPQGVNALMIAVKRKDEELVGKLISRGADPNAANSVGESARSLAEKRGPKRLLNILGGPPA